MKANTLKQREHAYKEIFKGWDASNHLITFASSCATSATSVLRFLNNPNNVTVDTLAQSLADYEVMLELTNQRYEGQDLAKKIELYKKQKVQTLIDRRLLEVKKEKAEQIADAANKAVEDGDKAKGQFFRNKLTKLFGNKSNHKAKKAKTIKAE